MLLLYVASIGPVWALAVRRESLSSEDSQRDAEKLRKVYYPLVWAGWVCPPFQKCISAYCWLWTKIIPKASLKEQIEYWERDDKSK